MMLKIAGMNHVVLWVTDMERSKHFYMDTFGMTVDEEDEGQTRVFLKNGPVHRLGLLLRQDGQPVLGDNETHHVGFTVATGQWEDVVADLESKGIHIHSRPEAPRTIYFYDPDHHPLQIHIQSTIGSDYIGGTAPGG